MVRATWLKSFWTFFSNSISQRPERRARVRSILPVDVRVMELRVLLSASALDEAMKLDVASSSLWQQVESFPTTGAARGASYLHLSDYTPLVMNETAVRTALDAAPTEGAFNFSINTDTITLVDPDGKPERFAIFETAIMAPELAAKFPDIKTYSGQGIDDPTATVQLDLTSQGFHAQVLSAEGRWYIDPYFHLNDDFYASYYSADQTASADVVADLKAGLTADLDTDHPAGTSARSTVDQSSVAARSGTQLRTYRTAVAADGEYTAFQGGTVNAAQAAIVTAINRVSGIYETELSIRLQLVANNSSLIYTNAITDPYTNDNADTLLDENQANIDTVIGNANYDIGHVFTTGGGGLASVGVVGLAGFKARGETGSSSPVGDSFYVDYVAREMGHQFSANHTFNVNDANRNETTAYEPGSGSTIMAYAGLFGADNLQSNSDAYFHSGSFDEIINFVDTVIPSVGTRTSTGNHVPTVNAGSDFTIPASTPFALTAVGADADGTGSLTYNWEERDLGAAQSLSDPDNGFSPLFRSFTPTSSPTRTFPKWTSLLSNSASVGEKLPTTTREMKFRATVRDNNAGGGGVNTDDIVVNVVNTGAAFAVTAPNTAVSWTGGSSRTVTWNVAGTTANGINTANVRILLSTDGGNTFGTVLTASTANDGSADIVVPNIGTTQARIKVEAVGNIFFDVSNANFTITAGAGNTVPSIGGPVANQPVNDNGTIAPFSALTVTDPDTQAMSAIVRINNGVVRGDFTGASVVGWTRTVSGNNIQYARTFNSAANIGATVQNAIRSLVFQPRTNAITPNTTEATDFLVTVTDGVATPVSNSGTSVIVTSVNNLPMIGGASASVAVNDNATVNPFNPLTVTDADNQEMLAKVTILNGTVRGDFTNGVSQGWTRTVLGNNINYVRYFSPGLNIGATVQAAFRALIFQPRANVIKPGTTELTDFLVSASDGVAPAVSNSNTRVTTTSVNNAPTIGGAAANQVMTDNTTKAVFSTLTVTDPDTQDTLARVTIPNGVNRGDFTVASTAGWTRTVTGSNIVYNRYFSSAANIGATVQAAIRALIFQPRNNVPIATVETTGFTVFINDGLANVSNSTTSVITTGVAPRSAASIPDMPSTILDSDMSTLVLPTTRKVVDNTLSRLLKKSK